MSAKPLERPPRIRTDPSFSFAHHTMRVRVPKHVDDVLSRNGDYSPRLRDDLVELRDAMAEGRELPPLLSTEPGAEAFRAALDERRGESWLATDWFFAETYAYRQLVERVSFWQTRRDPFLPIKREEYASEAHRGAFESALAVSGSAERRLHELFARALFGNRIDLSFAPSLERGTHAAEDDLLVDEREPAVRAVFEGHGAVHVVCDNAGTELTLDLTLCDFLLETLRVEVVLHVKVHPTFVSDAIGADVDWFLQVDDARYWQMPPSATARACIERLRRAREAARLRVEAHPFWNGPHSLWELPASLARELESARLVLLKGDANYRRAVGDALWPAEQPFREVLSYLPAPVLALRTLKSDAVVGLPQGAAARLDGIDPDWRVNGKRAVASFSPGRR